MAKVMLIPLSSTFLLVACCKTKLCVIIVKLLLFLAMVAQVLSPVPTYSAFDIPCLFPFICREAPTNKVFRAILKMYIHNYAPFLLEFYNKGKPLRKLKGKCF